MKAVRLSRSLRRRGTALLGRVSLRMAAGAIALGFVSCSAEGPCDGFSVGSHWTITLLGPEQSDPGFGPACGQNFDLMAGQSIDAVVTSQIDDDGLCFSGVPTYGPIGAWTWSLFTSGGNSSAVLGGVYEATSGSCHGVTQAELSRDAVPQPDGGTPPFSFYRSFTADADASVAASCPANCAGYFAASATRTN